MDHLDTLAIHADADLEDGSDVAPPIHVSTTFAASEEPGAPIYAREGTITRERLEAVLGALEGGHAITYASGQAASFAALLLLKPQRVAFVRGGYHGTRALLRAMKQVGVEMVDLDAPLREGDVLWVETPENPTCVVHDVAAHAARAHAAGATLVVDSTFATPMLQQPLALGADLVMHSMTKFLSGHSDALGGALVTKDMAVARELRAMRTTFGAVPGALEAWLVLRGLRTLGLRVRRQSETATTLAAWLAGKVPRVWHPSLPEHPGHEVAKRQMRGFGAMLAIELDREEDARTFPARLRLFRNATSLGGVESLAEWRRKHDASAPPGLVRISVGVEEPADLIADLAQALGH